MKHLRLHTVDCDGFTTSEIAADLLNGIRRLKSLLISAKQSDMKINNILDLIQDCPAITKLELYSDNGALPMNLEGVERLVNEHPALIEFDSCYELTTNDAIVLIRRLKSLLKFGLEVTDSEHGDFELQLNGEWESDGYHWYRNTPNSSLKIHHLRFYDFRHTKKCKSKF